MKTFQVKLPLPTLALSSNYRGHTRGKKAQETAEYLAICKRVYERAGLPILNVKAARGESVVRVRLDLDFYYGPSLDGFGNPLPDNFYRAKDEDSARSSFKAGQDALKEAGLIPDDSAVYVKCGDTNIRRSQKEHEGKRGVILTITVARLPTKDELTRAKPKPAISPAEKRLLVAARRRSKQGMKRTKG